MRAPSVAGAHSRLLRAFLRVPLFYKILLANAVIIVHAVLAAILISRAYAERELGGADALAFGGGLALAALGLTVLVNAGILKLALTQLQLLEETAERVQAGDLNARVPHSAVTDRHLERLTGTFNAMLDTLELYGQRLREVAARALNAEEEERKRIARELHDDTAQTLAALMVRLRVLRATGDEAERERVLELLREELLEALERVRRFARGLRPPALDELGLGPALESHVRALEETISVDVRTEIEPLAGVLSPQEELALYRIAQEALSNAARHSGAEHIELRLRRHGAGAEVEIRDDGRGFRVDEALSGNGGGLGLFGMRERALYVGGRVEIKSTPGSGTVVTVRIARPGGGAPLPRGGPSPE